MTVAFEAHQVILDRERLYGPIASSWDEVAELTERLASTSDTPGERAVLQLLVVKLVRRKHSPENQDHYRDACGYLAIMARLKARTE